MNSMLRVGSPTSMRGRGIGVVRWRRWCRRSRRCAEPDDRDDVAGLGLLDLDPAQLVEQQDAVDRARHDDAPGLQQRWPAARAGPDPATIRPMAIRPTYSEKSSVVQSIWNGLSRSTSGPGTFSTIRSKQGPDVAGRWPSGSCDAKPALARGEDVREVELLLAGAQLDEGVEDLVQDLVGPGVGPVDLVDHDDRADVAVERLAEHELGLGHRPLEGVDQHEGAVGHLERPLDLAAEVGVAGRVDQVDLGRGRS